MRIKLERPRLISLAAGFTDNPTLPVAGSRRLLNEMLGNADVRYTMNFFPKFSFRNVPQ
jgi:hypothetical protein